MRLRLVRLLMLCLLGFALSPVGAQDVPADPTEPPPSETPTDIPAELPTEVPTESATPTELPTDIPIELPTEVPTEVATETPTEEPAVTETIEPATETPTESAPPELTLTTSAAVAPEPALSLVARELFEIEPLVGWTLPTGWARTTVSDGFALRVDGAAGSKSAAGLEGTYYNVAVMGYFTFLDAAGTGQLIVRDSSAGSYSAQVDANGLVTLEKYDGSTTVVASWNAVAPAQTAVGAARALRLSAMGGILRIAVDNLEVLVVEDVTPLPPGGVKVGAQFSANGATLFDNFFLWVPTSEVPVNAPTTVPSTLLPVEVVNPTPIPPTNNVSGKSTIPQAAGLEAGPLATSNDDFANRIMVSLPYSHTGDTSDNSVEPPNEPTPSCGFNISYTAWYEFTPPNDAPASESFLITTTGSTFDTMMAVYTGSWGSLTEVACSDDVGSSALAQLTTTLNDGVTYYIQVGGYNGSAGNYTFTIMRPAQALLPGIPVISNTAAGAPSTPLPNAGKTNLAQPVIAWNASGAVVPYAYEVQIATANNFAVSSIVATAVVNEPNRFYQITPSLLAPTLPTGRIYYWRVRALNFPMQASGWSPTYNFTFDTIGPSAPALIAPALNSSVPSLFPTFMWQAVADAASYHIRVASNFSCSTIVSAAFDTEVATTRFTAPVVLPQGEYWFCVESKDAAGNWSGFGEKRRFTINLSLTPARGALVITPSTLATAKVNFTWTSVPGATYTLAVATDSSFTAHIFDPVAVVGTSYTADLPFGNYYWRVHVNGAELPMSLAYDVTVTPPLPMAPAIQTVGAPPFAVKNAGFTNDTTPFMDWTVPSNWVSPHVGQSITYELQLATDRNFTSLVVAPITGIPVSDFEWNVTTLPDTLGMIYYWRVRARTNLGVYGNWSPAYSFMLDTTKPNTPASLLSPVDNLVSTAARPTFTWQPSPGGASSYRFEISPNSADFDLAVIPDAIVTTPRFTPTVSLPQGTYYWQVWARDAAGNESLLPAGFRTLTVDYRTAPVANFAVGTNGTTNITFTWVLVTGAPSGTTYTIEIDTGVDGNPDITAPAVTAAKTIVNGLNQGAYSYRLAVNNGFGTSGWRTFFVSPPLPGAPLAPFAPANGVSTPILPTLQWQAPTVNPGNVTGYRVEIATDKNFANPIAGSPFDAGNTLSYTPASLSDAIYYWRVRAYDSLGAHGAYSPVLSFTMDSLPPDPSGALTAPVDQFVSTSGRVTFTWAAPPGGASSYRFEISSDMTDFDPALIPDVIVPALRYAPTFSLPQGIHYWRVWSRDAAGNESLSPSEVHMLTVDYRTSPVGNFITRPDTPITFMWGLVMGAPVGTTYIVEIDSNFDTTPDITSSPTTANRTTMSGITLQGQYQYRLVVSNGFGTSPWRSFHVSPLPSAPTAPFMPANGAIVPVPPDLQWQIPTVNPDAVATYVVEIATDANFNNPVAGSPFDVGNVLTYTPSLTQGIYYWRVQAKTSLNLSSPYTPTMRFTIDTTPPPSAPALTAPSDNALTNLPRPTFTWAAAPEANRYVIEIDDEAGFNTPLFHSATITTRSYSLPTSTYLRQGYYYWRVWAMDAAGNLNPGPIGFRTLVVNYAKTPADNGLVISVAPPKVMFTWSTVPISPVMAGALRLQIDNDSDFSSPHPASSSLMPSTSVSYTTPITLPHGKYYWRLLVNGHPAWPIALARSFTISPVAPSAPVLSALPAAMNDTTPQFSWNAVSSPAGANVTGYQLQLSTTNTFAVLVGGTPITVAGGSTTNYEWSPELASAAGQAYYVRVRAVTNLGMYSNWSAVRAFTLDTSAPTVPILTSPANNSTVTTQTPTFSWQRVTGAVRYEIRYGTSSNLVGVSPISLTSLSYRPPTALALGNYYWEVRAIDAAGNAINWDDSGTWNAVTNRRNVKIIASS